MKKTHTRLLLLFTFLCCTKVNFAQQASGIPHTYAVTPSGAASYPGTGSQNLYAAAGVIDEQVYLAAPAGFSMNFGGVTYTKIIASTNGWIMLVPGSVMTVPAAITPSPVNNLANNTSGYPIIAPLWDDLSVNLLSYNYYLGSLWVRWSVKWQNSHSGAAAILFLLKIDAATGVINFYYANNGYVPNMPSASIGIAGACVGDFYSVSTTGSNTAYIDSLTENTNIGQGGATTMRPFNVTYTWTPLSFNDACANAIDLGTISGTCTNRLSSTIKATAGGATSCAGDVNDVYFKFIKPAGATGVTVTTSPATCGSVTGTTVELFDACGGTSLGCATTSTANPNYGAVTAVRPCPAETLWVKVTGDADQAGKFNICATTSGNSNGQTCATATPICGLPYVQAGMTTAGAGNDYDSTSSACHTVYMNGEDYVFTYTPTANQCIRVALSNTGQNPGVFVYSGCPTTAGTYCLASNESTTNSATINSVSLTGGQTYYIVVDNSVFALNTNIGFDISVTAVGTSTNYDACGSTPFSFLGNIGNGVSCTPQTFTTECSTPTPVGQAGVPSCVPTNNPPYFIDGVTGDVWLYFNATFSGSLLINTSQSAVNPTSNAAMAIYTGPGCPTTGAAPYACDYNSGPNGMPSLSIPVVNGTTYFIRVWSENPENQGNFDICFQSACSPPNDQICGNVFVPLGGTVAGFNTCASGTVEPANSAQCLAGGTVNTVWYSTVVPPGGQVRVRTHPLTLVDTQIQGFTIASGVCSNYATAVSRGCNDNGTACDGGGINRFSDITFTGLPVGDTLYVAVDGVGSLAGTFEITFMAVGQPPPPVYQQDCENPQIICSSQDIVVPDPGFQNYGNVCDLLGAYGCFNSGERNSIWYQFTVDPALTGGTATLAFDIFAPVDIDFLIWDITGLSNVCASVAAHSLPIAGCNWSGLSGATGLATPQPSGAYGPAIVFSGAPRTYLLFLAHYGSNAATNAGYTLHFRGTPPPISSTAAASVWDGQTNNNFATPTNWGDCGTTPTCATDATINATANGIQPTITAAANVKNITINAGATLTIQAGVNLNVCGNFTNYGTLICQPNSTVTFIGTGVQTVTGNLTGTNSFANFTINKASGSVLLASNIDISGNYLSSNATSVLNFNGNTTGKCVKVGGNFTNWSGASTWMIGGSTLEFNGTGNQFYRNSNGQDTLNRVTINKTGGKVYLNGPNSNMIIDSVLTLTDGYLVTTPSLEVNMRWGAVGAVTGHSPNSYVDGRLRRRLFLGSIDFPVGDSLVPNQGAQNGYELANVTFTSSTVVPDILVWFNLWPAASPNGPLGFDQCGTYTTQWDLLPILNNGYWTMQRSSGSFNGAYNVTLYNTGGNNASGTYWSVAYAPIASNPVLQASWGLTGACVPASTMAIDRRNTINTPVGALGSTSFNHHYAAVQSIVSLPVELLYFTAERDGEGVMCRWETASETNNDYFEVQRSADGRTFETLGEVNGYGPGISSTNREYSYLDEQTCKGIQYYRLRQVDFDSRYSYSDIVAVNCGTKSGLEVFPNPAKNTITFEFDQSTDGTFTLSIVDITGREVYNENLNGYKGINRMTTDISQLAAGVYYLRISKEDENARLQSQFFKN